MPDFIRMCVLFVKCASSEFRKKRSEEREGDSARVLLHASSRRVHVLVTLRPLRAVKKRPDVIQYQTAASTD